MALASPPCEEAYLKASGSYSSTFQTSHKFFSHKRRNVFYLLPTAMADFESHLNRWQTAGVLDAEAVGRIRAYEDSQQKPSGLRWQGIVALILGAILLACGVALFVSAHWDQMGPAARLIVVLAMVSVFHLGGGWARSHFGGLSTALHAVGTLSTGAAIALVGQIFNIEEHWPAAVLMWAIAALAGWALLRDEAQQVLTLLLSRPGFSPSFPTTPKATSAKRSTLAAF